MKHQFEVICTECNSKNQTAVTFGLTHGFEAGKDKQTGFVLRFTCEVCGNAGEKYYDGYLVAPDSAKIN